MAEPVEMIAITTTTCGRRMPSLLSPGGLLMMAFCGGRSSPRSCQGTRRRSGDGNRAHAIGG